MVRVWAGFCLGGPLIPSSTSLRRWGSGPAREAEGGWGGPGPPCRLPCAPQTSVAASGRRSTPSSRAPCMRRWPQCSAWDRVSVSGGPGPTLAQPYRSFSSPIPAFLRSLPTPGFMCPGAASITTTEIKGQQAPWVGGGENGGLPPRPLRTLVAAEAPQSGCGSLSPAGLRGPPPRPERHLRGAAGGAGGPGPGSPWAPAAPPGSTAGAPLPGLCRGPGQRPQPGAGGRLQPGAGPSLSPLGVQGAALPAAPGHRVFQVSSGANTQSRSPAAPPLSDAWGQ